MAGRRKERSAYLHRKDARRKRGWGKRVIKGKVWTTVRRSTRRYFLFRPDEHGKVEQIFWYCLAVAAKKHGIIVHAAVLMSTHIHLVYTDPRGVQPDFKRDFHRTFAQGMKALLGWPEEVFNKLLRGEHEPLTAEAVLDDIAYLIANPVSAFAVRYAKDWPGPKTLPRDIGTRVVVVSRPDFFFDSDNPDWPAEAELPLEMPAILAAKYGDERARALIAEGVGEYERAALAESQSEGIPFRGARRCMRVPHTAAAFPATSTSARPGHGAATGSSRSPRRAATAARRA
jgi:putative transposase